jgi:hypothetical protein
MIPVHAAFQARCSIIQGVAYNNRYFQQTEDGFNFAYIFVQPA